MGRWRKGCAPNSYYARNREKYVQHYQANKTKYRAYQKKYAAEISKEASLLKDWLVDLLGGKCQRCGFDDRRTFQFHHTKNNGKEHRKKIEDNGRYRGLSQSGRKKYYKDLIVQHEEGVYPIRMVCTNCHIIIHDERNKKNKVGRYSE